VAVAERALQPGQAGQRDPGRSLIAALGRDEPAQDSGHGRPLVGEDPDVSLRAAQVER
jgi:hypothetical protein